MDFKKYLAEFIGTFLLCFVGCGGAILNSNVPASGPLIFFFLIIGLASGFGGVSGAHLNPSVSLAFLLNGQMKIKEFFPYIISQFLGALAGFFTLYNILLSTKGGVGDLACNTFGNLSPLMALFIEMFITAFFVYVILTNCAHPNGPFIIAGTLGAVAFFSGSLTGGSMNPVRSLAPALIMRGKYLQEVWVYIFGPLSGSVCSVLLYKYFNCKKEEGKTEKAEELVELENVQK